MRGNCFEFVLDHPNRNGKNATIPARVPDCDTVQDVQDVLDDEGNILVNKLTYEIRKDVCHVTALDDVILSKKLILSVRLSPRKYVFP